MGKNIHDYKLAYRRVRIDPSVEEKAVDVLMKSGQKFRAGPTESEYTISYYQCSQLDKKRIPYHEA